MQERVQGDVEILVHVSAPSSGKDDTRYRALASAYLDFEPVSHQRCSVDLEEDEPPALERDAASQLPAELAHSTPDDIRSCSKSCIMLDEEDDSYVESQSQAGASFQRSYLRRSHLDTALAIDSPQASFRSVLDNADSPAIRDLESCLNIPFSSASPAPRSPIANNESSWNTPPSVVPDSQSPYNRAIPEFSSPTRVLELYLQHFDSSKSQSSVAVVGGDSYARDSSSRMSFGSSQPQLATPAPRPGPRPNIGDRAEVVPSLRPMERDRESTTQKINKRRLLSVSKASSPSRSRSESDLSGLLESHVSPTESVQSSLRSSIRPATEYFPSQKRRRSQCPSTSGQPAHRKSLKKASWLRNPNEIHPPLPPTSYGPFPSSLTTRALQSLATQLSLASRYCPMSQTRPLRNLERGFWSVSMATWSVELRDRAWEALKGYVEKGRAGWGVWCLRCGPTAAGERNEKGCQTEDEQGGKGHGRGVQDLRVYCWGEVVGHVYLLLYLVSERRIKGTGSRWIDGGGETVIIMS